MSTSAFVFVCMLFAYATGHMIVGSILLLWWLLYVLLS
jgi:hypothetical protein